MLLLLETDQFELNLLYNDKKSPIEAFGELKEVFRAFAEIDKVYASNIDNSLTLSYSLENIEIGSVRTRIAQIIKEIPDEAIRDFEWKKLVGHFLLKLKYLILRKLEKNNGLASKEQIDNLNEEIENEKKVLFKDHPIILTEVNIYLLISVIEPLVNVTSKLKDGERFQYQSQYGSAQIDNTISINKAKMLWEIGDRTFSNDTLAILKIKKIDMLSNDPIWNFKHNNKSLLAKIIDTEWLDKYHNRELNLLPEDALKVTMRTTYINNKDGKIIKPSYEVVKVIGVVPPDDFNKEELF